MQRSAHRSVSVSSREPTTRQGSTTWSPRSEVRLAHSDNILIGQSQKILELNSTIIQLKEVITQKSDVEAQLGTAR
jgi:hypothetical protein